MSQTPPQPPDGWGQQPPAGPGWTPDAPGEPAPGAWAPGAPDAGPPPGPDWAQQPGYSTPPPGLPGGAPVKKQSPVAPIAALVVLLVVAVGAVVVISSGGDDDDDGGTTTGSTGGTGETGGGDGPEDVALAYFDAAVNFDCAAMVDTLDLSTTNYSTVDDAVAGCEGSIDPSEADSDDYPAELLGSEVVEETDAEADVTVEYRTNAGETTTEAFHLLNTDDGWKVDLQSSFGGGGGGSSTSTTTTTSSTTTTTAPTTTTTAAPPTTIAATPSPVGNPDAAAEIAENPDEDLTGWANACEAGDMAACDDLYWNTDIGGVLETYAKSCGGRVPEGGHYGDCEATFG